MLRCVGNDMNRWEILAPVYSKWQLLSICCCCKSVCFGKISDVAWEKMHFTWFSRRDGFSPTRHQILPSPLRGSGQDTVSSWEKTPSLLENHVKCISSTVHQRKLSYSTVHQRIQTLFIRRMRENAIMEGGGYFSMNY